MKINKLHHKVLGVVVTASVLLSMLVGFAVPAQAETLAWSTESLPSGVTFVTASGHSATDFAVSGDGNTIYATSTTALTLFKSTNGGSTWTRLLFVAPFITAGTIFDQVAIAPDDANTVVIVDNDTPSAWVSTNGALTADANSFSSLGGIADASAATALLAGATGLEIAPLVAGVRQVAISGIKTGAVGGIFALNLGGAVGTWTDITSNAAVGGWANQGFGATVAGGTNPPTGVTKVNAIKFSPNYVSDRTLAAVTEDDATGNVRFELASFSSKKWNSNAGFIGYDGTANQIIGATAAATPLQSASISLAPTYQGADSASRVGFVSIATEAADAVTFGGVYRMNDNVKKLISNQVRMKSVAFNGTNLLAGEFATNVVQRSTDPLAGAPTFTPASQFQRPSGGVMTTSPTATQVAWAGANAVASTMGNESAFAVSKDAGVTFNDASLVNTLITNVHDIAVSADGTKVYMVSSDAANDTSVWRKTGTTWERVMVIEESLAAGDTDTWIVRLAPENAAIGYVVNTGSPTLYYTDDSGEKNWSIRAANENITDVAVESAGVVYYLAGMVVRKSTNAGFVWSDPAISIAFTAGTGYNIKSIKADNLLVGSTAGTFAYSTNGGAAWTRVTITGTLGNAQVTAAGLATNDFVFATFDGSAGPVYRYKIGQAAGTFVDTVIEATGYVYTALQLNKGQLYAIGTTGVTSILIRSLNPNDPEPTVVEYSGEASDGDFVNVLGRTNNMQLSTGSVKVWAIDRDTATSEEVGDSTTVTNDEVYSFTDTLNDVGPTQNSPADKAVIKVNLVSGFTVNIPISWARPSKATAYQLQVATDSAFKELWLDTGVVPPDPGTSPVTYLLGGGGLNPSTTYYWRVRATDPLHSAWTAARTFSTTSEIAPVPTPTPAVALAFPGPGETGVALIPTFSWSAFAGANSYEIQVDTDSNFSAPVIKNNSVFTNVFVSTTALKNSTVYYWRVRATAGTITGPFAVGVFTTTAPPAPPTTPVPPVTVIQQVQPPPSTPAYIWAIIGIGALLAIAVLVLIMRTGRGGKV